MPVLPRACREIARREVPELTKSNYLLPCNQQHVIICTVRKVRLTNRTTKPDGYGRLTDVRLFSGACLPTPTRG